jgi:hypothetical protein
MIDCGKGEAHPMAGGARLVTALGGVPARFGVDEGIVLRGRHDAPG